MGEHQPRSFQLPPARPATVQRQQQPVQRQQQPVQRQQQPVHVQARPRFVAAVEQPRSAQPQARPAQVQRQQHPIQAQAAPIFDPADSLFSNTIVSPQDGDQGDGVYFSYTAVLGN